MSDKSESDTYQVEVGVERTGIVYIDAQSEEHARQKAKERAERHTDGLNLIRTFTNQVRSISTEDKND